MNMPTRSASDIEKVNMRDFNAAKARYAGRTIEMIGYVDSCRNPTSRIHVDLAEDLNDIKSPVVPIEINDSDAAYDKARSLRHGDKLRLRLEIIKFGREVEIKVIDFDVLDE